MVMRIESRRRLAGRMGARWLVPAGLALAVVAACQPSAPPGFTGAVPPDGGGSAGPGASITAPDASGLVAGKPVVTTDAGKVTVTGLGAGKSDTFDLPAGSATMVITPCGVVSPFVSLYDAKDNRVALTVDPTTTLKNLVGGSYYLDMSANPKCVWSVAISPS
jgi:hypothetical protein